MTALAQEVSGPKTGAVSDPVRTPARDFTGPTITESAWIARRLGKPDLFMGASNPITRRDELRALIVARGIETAAAGKKGGAEETWAQLFERLFGEPL